MAFLVGAGFCLFLACGIAVVQLSGHFALIREAVTMRHVCDAMRNNIPLASALYLASRAERGRSRRDLEQIARLLEVGMPLSRAAASSMQNCSALTISLLEAGEQSGALPAAAAAIERHLERQMPERGEVRAQRLTIFLLTAMTLIAVTLWTRYRIAGKIQDILWDFDVVGIPGFIQIALNPLPGASISTIRVIYDVLIAAVILSIPASLLFIALATYRRGRYRLRSLSAIIDLIRRFIPGLRAISLCRAYVETVPTMRLAVTAGMSLPDAIRLASQLDTDAEWRRTLLDWADRLRDGASPVDSGMAVGLPSVFRHYLAIGLRGNALSDAFERIESYYESELERRNRDLGRLFWPFSTLLLGLTTALFCTSIIMSLATVARFATYMTELPA